jgi:catechol 2,3-dioxygenase-like lactoylglutathione lyase family enzyme
VRPKTLDHVALWVADRDAIEQFVTERLSMHVIDKTDKFTLVGTDARHGKLTLFEAEGPRERGALEHVALRVNDLDTALEGLEGITVDGANGAAYFDVSEGLRLGLVEAQTEVEYDLDHVALFAPDPERTAEEYLRLGFNRAEPRDGVSRVEVGGAFVEFHPGEPGDPEAPLLNHVAVLVDSADEHIAEAKDIGVEIDDVVDAPNTYAVFLRGPEDVRIEYVEHKPTFSLT